MKTGTLVDATIIASASEDDNEARWVKHKGRPAVHGFKAHVSADADTAPVEEIAITPANINDGKADPDVLPDNPGDVFADSAYRGNHFGDAVRAKGGTPRIVATGMWGRDEAETVARLTAPALSMMTPRRGFASSLRLHHPYTFSWGPDF